MGMQEENPNIPNTKPENVVVPPTPTESNKVVEETPTSLDVANSTKESSSTPEDKPKGNNKILVVVGIIVLVLILAGIGYFTVSKNNSTSSPEPSPTPTASPEATPDPTADWETYTNTKYKYSFNYPSNWNTKETEDRYLPDSVIQETQSTTQSGNAYGFTVYISENTKDLTLEQFDANYKLESATGSNLIRGKEDTTLASLQAKKYDVFSFDRNLTQTITIQGGFIYKVEFDSENPNDPDFETNKQIYNQILSTFKFLEDTSDWISWKPTTGDFTINIPQTWSIYSFDGDGRSDIKIYPSNITSQQSHTTNNEEVVTIETSLTSEVLSKDTTLKWTENDGKVESNNVVINSNKGPVSLKVLYGIDSQYETTISQIINTIRLNAKQEDLTKAQIIH